mmetsp:Transcript_31494/g.73337  ORF Transcript_31494/g.73337 Transcript_31494/m.73337 type:complete len:216 (-) Transcript_31494:38-685(-)
MLSSFSVSGLTFAVASSKLSRTVSKSLRIPLRASFLALVRSVADLLLKFSKSAARRMYVSLSSAADASLRMLRATRSSRDAVSALASASSFSRISTLRFRNSGESSSNPAKGSSAGASASAASSSSAAAAASSSLPSSLPSSAMRRAGSFWIWRGERRRGAPRVRSGDARVATSEVEVGRLRGEREKDELPGRSTRAERHRRARAVVRCMSMREG